MNRDQWIMLAIGIVAVAGTFFMYQSRQSEIDYLTQQIYQLRSDIVTLEARNKTQIDTKITSSKNVSIEVYTPLKRSKVKSPLYITGKVPGNWSFEASFPIELVDSSGKILAKTTGQVVGDWMTSEMVPFSATLSWDSSYTGPAKLIIKKDNPSGLLDKEDSVEVQLSII